MNSSERAGYEWLIEEKGYAKEEIVRKSAEQSPDFILGEEGWEVKKLYGNKLVIYPTQIEDFRNYDTTIIVVDGREVLDTFKWANKDDSGYRIVVPDRKTKRDSTKKRIKNRFKGELDEGTMIRYLSQIENLRQMRIENGLTQRELARKAGVSQAHIAKIENGKVDPRVSTINEILSVLKKSGKTCGDIMTEDIITADPEEKVKNIVEKMDKHDISQVPVIKNGRPIGKLTEKNVVSRFREGLGSKKAKEIMTQSFPIVPVETDIRLAKTLLEEYQSILIERKGEIKGIISRSDLLKAI